MQDFKKKYLFKIYGIINLLIMFACSVLSAAYVNVVTLFLTSNKISFLGVMSAICNVGWWNGVLFVVLLFIYIQYRISSEIENRINLNKDRLINKIMEVTARSIVSPRAANERHIRAIVTLYREKR